MPERTAAYISQHDLHIGEMTVRETLAFSARCQGVGNRFGTILCNLLTCNCTCIHFFCLQILCYWLGSIEICLSSFLCIMLSDMLTELSRREKAANIKPDADIDAFMKARFGDPK